MNEHLARFASEMDSHYYNGQLDALTDVKGNEHARINKIITLHLKAAKLHRVLRDLTKMEDEAQSSS